VRHAFAMVDKDKNSWAFLDPFSILAYSHFSDRELNF
jgi:hypothetical protein